MSDDIPVDPPIDPSQEEMIEPEIQTDPPKRKAGRKSRLTRDMMNAIIMGIESDLSLRAVCQLCKIDYTTYHNWMNEGRDSNPGTIKREFFEGVEAAKAKAEKSMLDLIRTAAERGREEVTVVREMDANGQVSSTTTTQKTIARDWRAAAWILEHRHPDDYGKRVLDHRNIPSPAASAPPVINLIFDDGEGDPNVIPFENVPERNGNGHGDSLIPILSDGEEEDG